MSDSHAHDDEEDNNNVFLDDSDIIHEVALDDEVLPEASDPIRDFNSDSDSEIGINPNSIKLLVYCVMHSIMLESRKFDSNVILNITEEVDDSDHIFTGHTGEISTLFVLFMFLLVLSWFLVSL